MMQVAESFRIRSLLAPALMIVALASGVASAQAPVGYVSKMVETTRGNKVKTTQLAQIWSGLEPRYPVIDGDLFKGERVRIENGLWMQMMLESPGTESRIALASDPGMIDESVAQLDSVSFGREGLYEIGETVSELTGFGITVLNCLMHLRLLAGGVEVRAAGTVSVATGTELVYVVGADSNNGLMYLREGHVRFPDYSDITVNDGDLYRLRRGQRPILLSLTAAQVKKWDDISRYGERTVWSKPFWQQPAVRVGKWVVGAAAVGGLGYLTYKLVSGGSSGVNVDIVIPD